MNFQELKPGINTFTLCLKTPFIGFWSIVLTLINLTEPIGFQQELWQMAPPLELNLTFDSTKRESNTAKGLSTPLSLVTQV